jgi:energy-coupling factor transporter ATP-binding protein EcfA2
MQTVLQVKVFISCPSDVLNLKNFVKKACDTISNDSVAFTVIDWKNIIGKYGVRPQQQINEVIGDYDIYIGILWKRFGTPTGSINSKTGTDYSSGTEEEFLNALDRYNVDKRPQIHFFIRTDRRIIKTISENAQFGKVLSFIDSQKKSNLNFLNEFKGKDEFFLKILNVINTKQLEIIRQRNVQDKNSLLSSNDLAAYRIEYPQVSHYLSRILTPIEFEKDAKLLRENESKQLTLEFCIQKYKYIVVLGEAGSGKSTELRNLAIALNEENSPFFPIYKRLNNYVPDTGLENFLDSVWKKIPQHLLVIILDGLDEIQPQHFNTAVRQINSFKEAYPELRIIISSRTNFYSIPTRDSSGTLNDFKVYMLKNLASEDYEKYLNVKFDHANKQNFKNKVTELGLDHFLTRPFFLMMLSEAFLHATQPQTKSEFFETYIKFRFAVDKEHFKTTIDVDLFEIKLFQILERIAICLELVGKNSISIDELTTVIEKEHFAMLKFTGVFRAQAENANLYEFEHNNIQEYLAAKALSRLSFDNIVRLIAFQPNHNKLIPTWVNTISFLFGILDRNSELLLKLTDWLIVNDKEVIVKMERDKIPPHIRKEIFRAIFSHYKTYDIWISSNKFSDEDLASFVSEIPEVFEFLVTEIKTDSNGRTTKINAISILEHWPIDSISEKQFRNLRNTLFTLIKNFTTDNFLTYACLMALAKLGGVNRRELDKTLKLIASDNQYVNAGIYYLLLKSNLSDSYVDYLITTHQSTRSRAHETNRLFDENYYLEKCLTSLSKPNSLKKLMKYISEDGGVINNFYSRTVITDLMTKAVLAYREDHTIINGVIRWLASEVSLYRFDDLEKFDKFFDETASWKTAFLQAFRARKTSLLLAARLLTKDSFEIVADEVNEGRFKFVELQRFIFNLKIIRNRYSSSFEAFIQKSTRFVLPAPEPTTSAHDEKPRIERLNSDFKLLFEPGRYRQEVLRIFDEEERDEITQKDLFELREYNRTAVDEERYFPSALKLLRDLSTSEQPASKSRVQEILKNEANLADYLIQQIFEYLSNRHQVTLDNDRANLLKAWCNDNVGKVDFKTAIKVNTNGSFSYKTLAMRVYYFSRRLKVIYSDKILLDMLSFDFFEGHEWFGIDYPLEALGASKKQLVNRRIGTNLRKGIKFYPVLKNHVDYSLENNLKPLYPYILKEINNHKRKDHERSEILRRYFGKTKDVATLTQVFKKSRGFIKWELIKLILDGNENLQVVKHLEGILRGRQAIGEKLNAASNLIRIQNKQGLKFLISWLQKRADGEIALAHDYNLKFISKPELLPHLIQLLELSYKEPIKVDTFHSLESSVLAGIELIALQSEENLMLVSKTITEFVHVKSNISRSVPFLMNWIARVSDQFYINQSQQFSIYNALKKIDSIPKLLLK